MADATAMAATAMPADLANRHHPRTFEEHIIFAEPALLNTPLQHIN
jgi:hypothetical protein